MNLIIIGINDGKPSGVATFFRMLSNLSDDKIFTKIFFITFESNLSITHIEKTTSKTICIHIPLITGADFIRLNEEILKFHYTSIFYLIKDYFSEKNQKNIIHLQEIFLFSFASYLKSRIGGYIITHVHVIPWKLMYEKHEDIFTNYYRQTIDKNYSYIRQNLIEQSAYKNSDHIICVSESGKYHVNISHGIPSSKISVIYNGLSDYFATQTIKIGGIERPKLIFVGRVTKEKGFLYLLEALTILYKKNIKPELNVFGEYTKKIQNLLLSKYSQLTINLHGKVDFNQLVKYYLESPNGIIPSIHEQCSYTAIEMTMFGLPIIVSDIDALSEMFENYHNAIKIPLRFDYELGLQYDANLLANSIELLLTNGDLRNHLCKMSRDNFLKKFTLNQMFGKLLTIYKTIDL